MCSSRPRVLVFELDLRNRLGTYVTTKTPRWYWMSKPAVDGDSYWRNEVSKQNRSETYMSHGLTNPSNIQMNSALVLINSKVMARQKIRSVMVFGHPCHFRPIKIYLFLIELSNLFSSIAWGLFGCQQKCRAMRYDAIYKRSATTKSTSIRAWCCVRVGMCAFVLQTTKAN